MRFPWARSLAAGVGATAAMTATTALESRLRGDAGHPIDYDASSHVAVAVGTVLRRPPRTDAERTAYFLLAHWGYGSAVALGYPPIRARLPHDLAAVLVFHAGCQAMAMTLFPVLGGTEPPWRWRRDMVVSSLAQHAVYVVAVAGTGRLMGLRYGRVSSSVPTARGGVR